MAFQVLNHEPNDGRKTFLLSLKDKEQGITGCSLSPQRVHTSFLDVKKDNDVVLLDVKSERAAVHEVSERQSAHIFVWAGRHGVEGLALTVVDDMFE